MSEENKLRFSKKIVMLTITCTILYAITYLILCFKISQLPDYSFNAGIFAALTAENGFNAWIKAAENKAASDLNISDTPIQEEP